MNAMENIRNSVNSNVTEDENTLYPIQVESLSALRDFHEEQVCIKQLNDTHQKEKIKNKLNENDLSKFFPEDWQISQFWYDKRTTAVLVEEVDRIYALNTQLPNNVDNFRIACISCPSLFRCCHPSYSAHLYEYDKRFEAFGNSFFYYDFNFPENVPSEWIHSYSLLILDPPFLSPECLEKMSKTVKLLAKSEAKIILCTAQHLENEAKLYLGLHKTDFIPSHRMNGIKLRCEFACFSNYKFGIQ